MKEELQYFERLQRLAMGVTWMVVISLVVVVVVLTISVGNGETASVISAYAAAGGPLLAALSVALIAERQLQYEKVRKRNERDLVVVQSMHQLIALTNDLKAHVAFIGNSFGRTDKREPILVLSAHKHIRQRYEDMCAGHVYQWIENETLGKLSRLSGSIFGLCVLLEEAENVAREKGLKVVPHVPDTKPFDDLVAELSAFADAVWRERRQIDYSK